MTTSSTPPELAGLDLANFWLDSDYAHKEYLEPPPTPELIATIEAEPGYKLPASYIALMRTQNPGHLVLLHCIGERGNGDFQFGVASRAAG